MPAGYDATGGDGEAGVSRVEDEARGEAAGPYAPGVPYRPPNPATNPYLRVPDELLEPQDARPDDDSAAAGDGDIHGAPTVVRPVAPPPRGPGRSPGPGNGNGPPARADDGPPPPPPPPPPRRPRGGR